MAWGTQLKRKLGRDAFLRARLRLTVYFVAFCVIMFFTGSMIIDHVTHGIMLEAFQNPSVLPPEEALSQIDHIRWGIRLFYILGFAIGAYFLMGFALRPVRDAVESERRFIANISHELRTPLTLAKTETELLLKKPGLELPRAVEGLKRNLEDIGHLSRIIQFLLVLSDFNGQKAASAFQTVALADVIREAAVHSKRPLEEKRITLQVSMPNTGMSILGNPVALEKMLLNLVRNAATYSAEGSTITITAEESQKGALVLAVADEGVGMNAQDLEKIFEPFYRGMNAHPGGTGLGLTIVREVARLHGARIDAKSAEGKGTTFTITFPS